MREIIAAVEAGNTGLHQFGFRRFVRLTLDCGHQKTVVSELAHTSRILASEYVGGQAICQRCRPENLFPRPFARVDAREVAELARVGAPAREQAWALSRLAWPESCCSWEEATARREAAGFSISLATLHKRGGGGQATVLGEQPPRSR